MLDQLSSRVYNRLTCATSVCKIEIEVLTVEVIYSHAQLQLQVLMIKYRHRRIRRRTPQEGRKINYCLLRLLARAGAGLGWLAATGAPSVHLTFDLGVGADVLQGGSVAVVGVDASKFTTVDGSDAFDVDIALALLGALVKISMLDYPMSILPTTYISARPVQLAVVLNIVVDDVDRTTPVVLNDFVGSVVGTTTDDPGFLPSYIILDTDSVLADVFEPDKLESTMAIAVYTFGLVLADNHIAESGTRVEQEYSVCRSCEMSDLRP